MGNPIRVLLVDDEERFVQNLAKLLRGRGFEVATAFDGAAGVAAVEKSEGFDVVLLDVKMPGMDGIETLRNIKEISPETEVVMLTGHANVETGIAAMREGALDYLMKPCDIEDLVAKITEAARDRRHPAPPRAVAPSYREGDRLAVLYSLGNRRPVGKSPRSFHAGAGHERQGRALHPGRAKPVSRGRCPPRPAGGRPATSARALHRVGRFDRPSGMAPGRPPAQHHAAGSPGGDGPRGQPGRGRPPHAGQQRALHAGHRRRAGSPASSG